MRAVVTTWGLTPAIATSTAFRFRLAGLGLLVVTLLLAAGTVGAATFTVTKTADTADGTCDADCSLREAVIAANASAGADTITLPAGTYVLTLTGTPEEGALTGDLDITDDLTINGVDQATTIIDGDGGPLDQAGVATDRVFEVQQGTVVLNDITVQGGHPPAGSGGGIRNAGDLTINDSRVHNNVGRYGGGIMNGLYSVSDSNAPGGPSYSFTDISTTGTALSLGSGNSSLQEIGFDFTFYGRTHSQVFVSSKGYLTFTDNSTTDRFNQPLPDESDPHDGVFPFWDNLEQGTGNVYVQTLGSAPNRRFVVQYQDVRVCEFSGCSVFTDAATFQVILEEGTDNILFQYVDVATDSRTQGNGATVGISGPETQLDGVQYSYDQPVLSDNLAVRFTPQIGTLALNTVTVQNNDSTDSATGDSYDVEGAGLYNTGTATIDASQFTGNLGEDAVDLDTSGNGGGLANRGGTVTVTASTISNNTAGQNGGGVSNRSGTLTLDDTLVSGNTVYCADEPNGGGAANRRGELAIVNGSQIINNTLDTDGCDASGAGIMTLFGTVRVEDSEVSGNVFTLDGGNGAGGGIMARMSTVIVDNSLVTDNVTDEGFSPPSAFSGVTGGGIDAVKSIVEVRNVSEVSRNINNTLSPTELTDSLGGGFRVISSNLTVADSAVSDNDAGASSGGGIASVGYADYSVIDSTSSLGPTYSFEDISGTGTTLALTDGSDQQVAIGFPFRSFEAETSDVWISDDGMLFFGGSFTDPSVFGFDDDLDPTTGTIYYETRGTAPNRRFIVQYQGLEFTGDPGAGSVTFQMILNEGSNDVLMQYAGVEASDRARGSDALVGVRGGSGSLPNSGEQFEYSRRNPALSNGLAVRFPATGDLSVSNTTIANNAAGEAGGGIFAVDMAGVETSVDTTTYDALLTAGNTPDCVDDETGNIVPTIDGSGQGSSITGTCAGETIELAAGNRMVNAGEGNDRIRPSGGRQTLTGGPGTDTFVYDSVLQIGSVIVDFAAATPEIMDMAGLMTSIGYAGTDPLADGIISFRDISGLHTIVQLDLDGSSGPSIAKPYLTLLNVPVGNVSGANFAFGLTPP